MSEFKYTAHPGASREPDRRSADLAAPSPGFRRGERRQRELLIEGYAALFGIPDQSGDVVRAGAFAHSLRSGAALPMLLQHRQGALAGRWTRMVEDGRGLFVRGLIGKAGVEKLVRGGLDGLSIGFRPRLWKALAGGGRELIEVDLVEVSLVATPMQARARFAVLGMEAA
ncbi:MAG TPA: HK97 family phage prohead protease [Hyphomonas sp.]|nr:HK97 family phage prohead protease [Hyphomonas sp.]MCA8903319.1 HK97 family phage prohead protease [Hyphomonas sp.]MCB9962236.1 HK97 family phage prohead protease [Hyphomonas sp.]MCB9969866.1 HK97 family phage prohead protease [Hyphomonas sp.]HPE46894.1 HK97 family phage prohead protease [Hyphomonas sp.]